MRQPSQRVGWRTLHTLKNRPMNYVDLAVREMKPDGLQEVRAARIIAMHLYSTGPLVDWGQRMLDLLPRLESYVPRKTAVALMMRWAYWRMRARNESEERRELGCEILLEYVYLNGDDDSDEDYVPEQQ